MREFINPESLPPAPGYTQVVRVSGETAVYVAGQVAWDRNGEIVGDGDFEAQTRQVFANLQAALESVGAGFDKLVKIGVYIVDHDVSKLAVIRRVRDEFFGQITPPASTLLGVQQLAVPGLMVEIDAIAYLD